MLLLAPSDPPNTSITRHRLRSGFCTRSHCVTCRTVTPRWLGRQGPSPTGFNGCSARLPEWSVEPRSLIVACLNCFTPSYIGWTFHVSSINSESQFPGVCRVRLLSTVPDGLLHAYIGRLKPPTPSIGQPSPVYDSTTLSQHVRLVVGLSPPRVRWNGTRFHTRSGTMLGVSTASNRL